MRRIVVILALCVAAVSVMAAGAGADDRRTYRIEMLNAFGIYKGSDVRIAGVRAGSVTDVAINEAKRAVVEVELSGPLSTLGERTTCSTEPQSLIAEYFIDCAPRGTPLAEGETIPANRVSQSVQTDLLLNTFREPVRERLRLVVNELGTAMAANEENLNEAIRLSVPALTDFRRVTKILAGQRRRIDRLNAGAERVVGRLAERRDDVVEAIEEGHDAAEAAASRRADLSRDVDLLDDFNAELRPTLAELGEVARQGTPLLASLRAAAPGLDELATRLPDFSDAAGEATVALGEAAVPGRRALVEGREDIEELRAGSRKAPATAEILADFLRDLDDTDRIVEEDERAERGCGERARACWSTGREGPTGYTGLEALLNYVYYQTGAVNQFDEFGHFLAFNAFEVGAGPCGGFNAGPDVPARGGGRTTEFAEIDPCVNWLGPNQPDVSFDLGLPRYDNAVCPHGSTHPEICDPDISTNEASDGQRSRRPGKIVAGTGPLGGGQITGSESPKGTIDLSPGPVGDSAKALEQILGIADGTTGGLGGGSKDETDQDDEGGAGTGPEAAEALLDFLYGE